VSPRRALPFLLLLAPAALAAEPLTLAGALRQAAATSLAADAARLSSEAAQADTAQVEALYRPVLDFAGGFRLLSHEPALITDPIEIGPLEIGPFTTPPLTLPGQVMPIENRDSWRYQAALQYLAWDFGRRSRALDASRARERAVALAGGAEVRGLQAEVAARYLALLDIAAQERVVAERRRALESHLEDVRNLYEHGVVARNDLLRTEVALRAVEDADGALDQARESALEALNVALGLAVDTPQELPGELEGPPDLPWDEAACRDRAAAANEGVRALRARVEALESRLAMLRKENLPNVVAELRHTYVQNSYLLHEHDDSASVGLAWKLSDGGVRAARVRQAESELERARRDLADAVARAESAAAAALRDYRQGLRETATARANVAAAEENLRIVGDQYREGLIRSTEVLDAEAVLAESRSALASRRYRAFARQAALLALLGEDLPAFYDRTAAAEN
jgi:outer membrane protein TolC